MIGEWDCDGLANDAGRFYDFSRGLAVGKQLPKDHVRDTPGNESAVIIRQEDDKSFTVIIVEMSKREGREVILSSNDTGGAVQTRYADQRAADETFTCLEPASGSDFSPRNPLWAEHTRTAGDGVRYAFVPTVFSPVNVRKK